MFTIIDRSLAVQICSCLAAIATFTSVSRGGILFDSFTPPSTFGGVSSPNSGLAIKVSVASTVTISGMAVMNRAVIAGAFRFCILDYVTHAFLLLTDPVNFPPDATGIASWKDSTPFSFTLLGGHDYFVGYLRSIDVIDIGDFVAESQNGITSDLEIRGLSGFTNPALDFSGFTGADNAFRLYTAVPDKSSTLVLLAFSIVALILCARRLAKPAEVACGSCEA